MAVNNPYCHRAMFVGGANGSNDNAGGFATGTGLTASWSNSQRDNGRAIIENSYIPDTNYSLTGLVGDTIRITFDNPVISIEDLPDDAIVSLTEQTGGTCWYANVVDKDIVNYMWCDIVLMMSKTIEPALYSNFVLKDMDTAGDVLNCSLSVDNVAITSNMSKFILGFDKRYQSFRVNDLPNGIFIKFSDSSNNTYRGICYQFDHEGDMCYVTIELFNGTVYCPDTAGKPRAVYYGGALDGTDLRCFVLPDYSVMMINGIIKPAGPFRYFPDHVLVMSVDTDGQYQPGAATIDNENSGGDDMFYYYSGSYSKHTTFRGIVFSASSFSTGSFFTIRYRHDLTFNDCIFDGGGSYGAENIRIAFDLCAYGSAMFEGNIVFTNCLARNLNGVTNFYGDSSGRDKMNRANLVFHKGCCHDISGTALLCFNEVAYSLFYDIVNGVAINATTTEVSPTLIHHNTIYNVYAGYWNMPFVSDDNSLATGNVTVENNIVVKSRLCGIGIGSGYGPTSVKNNLIFDWNRDNAGFAAISGGGGDWPPGENGNGPLKGLVEQFGNLFVNPHLDSKYRTKAGGVCDLGNGEYIGCFAPVEDVLIRERL